MGSPLFLALQILLYFLKSICQQRELPLLFVAGAVKFFSFYFVLLWGGVTGVTFIFSHFWGVLRVYRVAVLTFIIGYQDRSFLRISFNSSWGYLYFSLLCVLLKGGGRGRFFLYLGDGRNTILVSGIAVTHNHLPKEEKCFLGRWGEGGEDDLDLGGLRVGG